MSSKVWPTKDEIMEASAEQIKKWYVELPAPQTDKERKIVEAVVERLVYYQKTN